MLVTRKKLIEKYSIPRSQWDQKHDELLDHLQEYIDITETKTETGRYSYEVKGELPDSIPPLPRKSQMNQKKKDYEDYTIKALGTEFKPNSKSKIAREAIADFGNEKYGHISQRSVVERYIKEPFDKYGENDGNKYWCYYDTYEVLSDDIVAEWSEILAEEHISEREAANAFYRQQQGEDISKEKGYYRNALDRFKEKYGSTPILAGKWKIKNK
jgi:hypothetical protein